MGGDWCADKKVREWSRVNQTKCEERMDGFWCPGIGPRGYTQAAQSGWCKSGTFLKEWKDEPITLAKCQENCDETPGCNAFIYKSTRCLLKTSCAEIKPNPRHVPYIARNGVGLVTTAVRAETSVRKHDVLGQVS